MGRGANLIFRIEFALEFAPGAAVVLLVDEPLSVLGRVIEAPRTPGELAADILPIFAAGSGREPLWKWRGDLPPLRRMPGLGLLGVVEDVGERKVGEATAAIW